MHHWLRDAGHVRQSPGLTSCWLDSGSNREHALLQHNGKATHPGACPSRDVGKGSSNSGEEVYCMAPVVRRQQAASLETRDFKLALRPHRHCVSYFDVSGLAFHPADIYMCIAAQDPSNEVWSHHQQLLLLNPQASRPISPSGPLPEPDSRLLPASPTAPWHLKSLSQDPMLNDHASACGSITSSFL